MASEVWVAVRGACRSMVMAIRVTGRIYLQRIEVFGKEGYRGHSAAALVE